MHNLTTSAPRYSNVDRQKLEGTTYTPSVLAGFIAQQILTVAELPNRSKIRVLDPAVGDGALLEALINQIPLDARERLEVVGYDVDYQAVVSAKQRINRGFPDVNVHLEQKDFLEYVLNQQGYGDLFSIGEEREQFHLVIANPPYVRTQIIGRRHAQQIAQRFGLSGRVDLYYPFLLGISQVLDIKGTAGIITSNRFMTTKSGQAVRRELLQRFQISHVWDFGDTKFFDAAVLPAVLIVQNMPKTNTWQTYNINFSSIYETDELARINAADIITALSVDDNTVVAIPDGRHFRVRHGNLDNGGDSEAIWRIATQSSDNWLATVEANTWGTFGRIGKIRVGVKSTADKVFIRDNWDDLPEGKPELLRPLITRHSARRFKAAEPAKANHVKEILYPHETTEYGRGVVDLSFYPKAARYLEQHRGVLEARTYVIEAGRKWYELWVPHDPSAWASPKLVFPDISDKPIFWIDTDGGVVNGECYWLRCDNDKEHDLLWLALAVANSTFIEVFYDHRFHNKLYAGRRRFITQYVEKFPLPDPSRKEAQLIIALTKEIYDKLPSSETGYMADKLDALVWDVFGLWREEVAR